MLSAVALAVLHQAPSDPTTQVLKSGLEHRRPVWAGHTPVVVGTAKVAVTWSAAQPVVAEPPELQLQEGREQRSPFSLGSYSRSAAFRKVE